jgi:hypothetical protein
LKAAQPAERLLGSKWPCLISPELLRGGEGEMAGGADDVLPSPARPPSPSSLSLSALLSLVHDSANSWRYASVLRPRFACFFRLRWSAKAWRRAATSCTASLEDRHRIDTEYHLIIDTLGIEYRPSTPSVLQVLQKQRLPCLMTGTGEEVPRFGEGTVDLACCEGVAPLPLPE